MYSKYFAFEVEIQMLLLICKQSEIEQTYFAIANKLQNISCFLFFLRSKKTMYCGKCHVLKKSHYLYIY